MPSRRISGRLRSIAGVTSNSSSMIGAGPFSSASSSAASQPAMREFARDAIGEGDRVARAVLHSEHRDRRTEAEEAHAVAPLAEDLLALALERQAIDLDHVVQHAREDVHDLAEFLPVEARVIRERIAQETREVDRAEQARAVGRQRLLAARVGRADVLAPPVVVHLVDAVDEHEAGLGEIVGRGHDHVPQPSRGQRLVDLAEHEPFVVRDVVRGVRPLAPEELRAIGRVLAHDLRGTHREGELPVAVFAHGTHEFVGHEQRQVELPQPPGLALRADELHGVRMTDVERAHLRAAPTARGRHREAHLVVDIHEGQRPGRVGAGARDVRAARAQRRELVADAAAGLEREPGLVDLAEDVVHRVADRAGHRAVDRGRGGLVLLRAGVRGDATRRDRAAAQRPKELLVPVLAGLFLLDVRERARHALIGVVHRLVDGRPVLRGQAVFLVPDVEGRFLIRNASRVPGLDLHGSAHFSDKAPVLLAVRRLDAPPGLRSAAFRVKDGTDPADPLFRPGSDRRAIPADVSCQTQHVGSGGKGYAPTTPPSTAFSAASQQRLMLIKQLLRLTLRESPHDA